MSNITDKAKVLIETRGEGEVNQTAILIFDKWTGVIKDKDQSKNRF